MYDNLSNYFFYRFACQAGRTLFVVLLCGCDGNISSFVLVATMHVADVAFVVLAMKGY